MSSEGSDSASTITLSLVAQFDDINRLNAVLNDGYSEECFLAFVKQMEWVRNQWAAAEAEAVRLQGELDEALRSLAKWEGKFAHVRKLLDAEKRERNHVLKKYNDMNKLLEMARDLLFNDNRTKLNDETLQKLAFLNGTAQEQHAKPNGVPELNSTGTLLSEMSYSRSEDDLDISLASARRSWVQRGAWTVKDQPATKKRRSSGSSFTKLGTVEVQGCNLVAKATTTLTLEKAPTGHELKPPQNFQPISESSDEAPAPSRSKTPQRLSSKLVAENIEIKPSAPPRTDTESASDSPRGPPPQRTPSLYSGSPRARLRQHNFVAKNFYKRETCGPCGKTIKFAKVGVRCENCRAHAHPECRGLLPLPCVPPGPAAMRTNNNNMEGTIADWAPRTPPMVPALLVHCVNEVERRGLTERGVYRVGAVEKDVKRLKERFLRGCGSPQLHTEDIHVICGCIKDFLRSLREPLVSSALWSDFMHVATISDSSEATAALVHCVSQLPQPNRDTLAFLVLHLQKVAESPECEMGIDNLAKMFGPAVVGYGLTQPSEMYSATAQMVTVMSLLLRLSGEYWAQWACPAESSPPRPERDLKPRGFFFSPADTGVIRKKRNYFQ